LWSVKDIAAHLLGGDVWILAGSVTGFIRTTSRNTANSLNW
jgi:hypothetical protein